MDWRAYAQTHTLSDKQSKLADKTRKRENRIAALQKEVDKIRVGALLDTVQYQLILSHEARPWN